MLRSLARADGPVDDRDEDSADDGTDEPRPLALAVPADELAEIGRNDRAGYPQQRRDDEAAGDGERGGDRTRDLLIKSQMLYR